MVALPLLVLACMAIFYSCKALGRITTDSLVGEWQASYTMGTMQSTNRIEESLILNSDATYSHTVAISEPQRTAHDYSEQGQWELTSTVQSGTIVVLYGMHYFVNGANFALDTAHHWTMYAPDTNLSYIKPSYAAHYSYVYPDAGYIVLFPAIAPSGLRQVLLHGSMGIDPDSRGLPKEFVKVSAEEKK
jgi:hypothetical protein